jgi:hypothetical protein
METINDNNQSNIENKGKGSDLLYNLLVIIGLGLLVALFAYGLNWLILQ